MQIITLEHLKAVLNITHTAQDTRLTYLTNTAENEILDYCGLLDMDAFYALYGETETARASLEQAVLYVVDMRFQGKAVDVRGDVVVQRTLLKYRQPKFSSGTTE